MQIKNLRYDEAHGVYKASVDITRSGRTFRYPCEVPGDRKMGRVDIHTRLRDRAMQMSDSPR